MRKLLLFISIIALTSGCTIKYSFTGASIPPDAKTVFIADFKNMAPLVNPSLSNDLTEALKDKFVNQTSLKIGDENADLYFEGTITDYNTQPVAIKSGDIASQNRLTISVKVKFVNNKDPKANFDSNFSRYQDYDSQNSLSDVEDQLVSLIIEDLIDDIFTKSVVNW
ncbi:MAG: LptE family protein [Salinivirgaceae bacterium]|nr:LptE family protein [Salinivirgaceae bacterium]MBO7593918.1 LptE family protein [Salinivirgaceae bacterium]MBR5166735.1 LptE family protein [Salinivirgaceae bacterium]